MKKWIIVGIVAAVMLGVCALILVVLWAGASLFTTSSIGFPQVMNATAQEQEEQTLDLSGPLTLILENDYGDVQINAASSEIDQVVIQMNKTAYGLNQEDAETRLAAMNISITQNANEVRISYRYPQTGIRSGQSNRVDFLIQVPLETTLDITTSAGDVSVAGTQGDAELTSSYGDISVNDLDGAVKAETSSGDVEVRRVQAGDALLELKSSYGDITLEDCTAQQLKAYTSSGKVKLDRLEVSGDASAESDYGNIDWESGSANNLTTDASSGDITLKDITVEQGVKAHSSYGDLDLIRVRAGSYDLDTQSGSVSVDGASGILKAHSGYGSIKVTNSEDITIDLSTSSGSVSFSGSLGDGPHKLDSDYGNIQLSLPADAVLSIDLETDYGKVRSDLPVTLSGDMDEDHWVGTINGGGASLVATTNSGEIRIEILKP